MRRLGQRITIYDVAARAGVSISTVSLTANSPHRVREATRQRVLDAAGALGYRIGGRESERRTRTRIIVAAPFSSYSTYFRRLDGMLKRARNTSIEIIAHDLDSAAGSIEPLLDALPPRDTFDGLIVMGVPLSGAALRASRTLETPVVLVDILGDRPATQRLSVVTVDDLAGGREIGRHLRDRGHRQAIYLHEPQLSANYLSAAMVRLAGIRTYLEVDDAVCPTGANPGEVAHAALLAHPTVTALIAHHDALAAGVWKHFRTTNSARTRSVALVGYDDGPLAETIGLTTVRQPFEESGAAALDVMLTELSEDEPRPQTVILSPQLVCRDTTSQRALTS